MTDPRTPVQVTTDAIVIEWRNFPSRVAVDRIVARFRVTVLAEALETVRRAESREDAMRELTRMIRDAGEELERSA